MIRGLALLFFLWPALALSQTYPALHDVTGVAAEDMLNIRSVPSATGNMIGSLAHDATGIEVIRVAGNWAQINTGERAGWASMTYLARQPGQSGDTLPPAYQCFGTEPFWNMLTGPDSARFELAGEAPIEFGRSEDVATPGVLGKFATIHSGTSRVGALHVTTRRACSDGMSDRAYGLATELAIVPLLGSATLYSGCCSIAAD